MPHWFDAMTTSERRRKCINTIHANLVFRVCISSLSCFRHLALQSGQSWSILECSPGFPLIGLKLCKPVSRSDLVHSLDFLGTQEALVSNLVLQACILLCSVSDKSGTLLFRPCSHKNAIAHLSSRSTSISCNGIQESTTCLTGQITGVCEIHARQKPCLQAAQQ